MTSRLNETIKQIIGLVIVWRASLFIFTFFTLWLSQDKIDSAIYWQAWANWDGGHFLGIAKEGYVTQEQYAFFPLYPLLVRLFSFLLFGNFLAAGLLLSSLFLILGLVYFQKLAIIDFNRQTSLRSVFYILIFPTAFFFTAVYSESLFLFLTIASFYFARRKRWPIVGILAILASATKPFGILLWPALIFEYLAQANFKLSKLSLNFVWLLVPPLGLLSYMLYLQEATGDPLAFLAAQSYWQRETFAFPGQVIWEQYLRIFSLTDFSSRFFAIEMFEFLAVVFFLLLLFYSIGKLRSSYIVFSALLVITALSTGVLTSFPRIFLLAFPLFFSLANLGENRLFDKFLTIVFLLHQALFLTFFLNGIWIT